MILPSLHLVPKRDINGPDARRYDIRDTIYVSPSGKEGYLGAVPTLPTGNLFNVKENIQRLKKGNAKNIKVEFLGGRYDSESFFFKDNNFVFFKHDENGTPDYKITLKSHDAENRAVFDNSKTYTGFVSAGDLWKVKIDYEFTKKCSFVGYVNDVKTVPARWPKYGALSEYNTVTYNDITYMRCIDSSSGFLSSVYDYYRSGNSLSLIGAVYTLDFRSFSFTTIADILTSLPNATYSPGTFYIPTIFNSSSYRGINIYTNTVNNLLPSQPSNLDPYKTCTEKGENTVIREGDDYWFYYKPSSRDIEVGINNTVLRTVNHGNVARWFQTGDTRTSSYNGVFIGRKLEGGFFYYENQTTSNAESIGFNITNPSYLSIENLDFYHCSTPIVLNTPISGGSILSTWLPQFTTNVGVTGCRLYNSFSSGIFVRNLSKSIIYKNLVYSTEGAGIYYSCGHDLIVDNNIVKSSKQVDTRTNGDSGFTASGMGVFGQFIENGHRAVSLTGARVTNNDISFAGNNLGLGACRSSVVSGNKINNGGFGCNSDMACVYYGFAFGNTGNLRDKFINNLIYNARANTNNNFLGNLLYLDGTPTAPYIYNNILANGQTGIQHSSVDSPYVYNNIIYNTKVSGITNKSNGGLFPVNVKFYKNIFVTGKDFTSTSPSRAFLGWNGFGEHSRTISTSPYNCNLYYTNSNGLPASISIRPIAPWKNKIRYSAIATGGTSTIIAPSIAFNGENWIIGDPRYDELPFFVDGLFVAISSVNSSAYDYPWEVPDENWIYIRGSETFYASFSAIRISNTRRDNTSFPALSSDYNLFWSLMDEVEDPENDSGFFRYGASFTSFNNLTSYAAIPDPYKRNDNSRPDIFGEMQLIEQNSKLADPLFIDPVNFDFRLNNNSPAYDFGFEEIDISNVGVYNTPDDPYWALSAASLKAQPVINGHKDWADFQTIPFPYNSLIEYNAPQVD